MKLIHHQQFLAKDQASLAVFEYIEAFLIVTGFILPMTNNLSLIMNCSHEILNYVSGKALAHQREQRGILPCSIYLAVIKLMLY